MAGEPHPQRQTPMTDNLVFHPLTPDLMDGFGAVLRGNFGAGCWCMFPRLTRAETIALPGEGSISPRRRRVMTELAQRDPAPGLLAYDGDEPVGWIAVAPRGELNRVDRSRATPRVDDVDVWAIPCVTVRKDVRGRGIAVALIREAVRYAAQYAAPAVEAYPRAGSERTGDDNAYFGTETMFRRAGFEVIRGPLENRPRNWIARVVMRRTIQPDPAAP